MKTYKNNYKGVEEDYSIKALLIGFLIGMIIISAFIYLLLNL